MNQNPLFSGNFIVDPIKTKLDNLITIERILEHASFSVKDELCDLTIIADDGQLHVETSVLCRSSEVFFRMITNKMREATKREIKISDFKIGTIKNAYEFLVVQHRGDGFLLPMMPEKEEEFVELLIFAHTYSISSLLTFLKRVIVGQVINPKNNKYLPTRTSQLYFDLDKRFELGFRKHLFRAIFDGYRRGQPSQDITDSQVYFDLYKLIFSDPIMKSTFQPEIWTIQKAFLISFRNSGLDGQRLIDKDTPRPMIFALIETIADSNMRFKIAMGYAYESVIKEATLEDQKRFFNELSVQVTTPDKRSKDQSSPIERQKRSKKDGE